jgi:hypothetical protein
VGASEITSPKLQRELNDNQRAEPDADQEESVSFRDSGDFSDHRIAPKAYLITNETPPTLRADMA